MLLYKNGRFHMEKGSFVLPDGFYVEDDIDIAGGSAFCAWDPERKYLFHWRYLPDCGDAVEELKMWFRPDCGLTPLSEIAPVKVNDLAGYMVLYQSPLAQYCEARFDFSGGGQLALRAESKEEKAENIFASEPFQAVWKGLGQD